MAEVRYRASGDGQDWILAVEGDALVVLPASVAPAVVEAVWRKVGAGGIGSVLEALTGAFGTSLTAIPPFALAVVEPTGVRVAVRGPLHVVVDDAAGIQSVSGEGVATWTERFLLGASRFGIAPLASTPGEVLGTADAFPIRSGVVAASGVAVDVADVALPAAFTPAAPDPDPEPAAPEPGEPELAADIVTQVPLSPASAPTDASADTWLPAETGGVDGAAPVDDYDLLWGETVARPVAAAATAEAAEAEDATASPAVEAPTEAESATPVSSAVSAVSTRETFGDHDGETVSVADVRALRAAEREQFESTDSVPARRPTRGRMVLSTGRTVELERPVVIGRRPKSVRTSGAELPTLVAVESPEQDISRSHVEIRAEGEHVLVTDLDTTNGTVLLRAGQEPVRLHPNEPTMVITGDVLDIGDGVTVTFEDLL